MPDSFPVPLKQTFLPWVIVELAVPPGFVLLLLSQHTTRPIMGLVGPVGDDPCCVVLYWGLLEAAWKWADSSEV